MLWTTDHRPNTRIWESNCRGEWHVLVLYPVTHKIVASIPCDPRLCWFRGNQEEYFYRGELWYWFSERILRNLITFYVGIYKVAESQWGMEKVWLEPCELWKYLMEISAALDRKAYQWFRWERFQAIHLGKVSNPLKHRLNSEERGMSNESEK